MQRFCLRAALAPAFFTFVACADDISEDPTGSSSSSESATDSTTVTTTMSTSATMTTTADTSEGSSEASTIDPDSSGTTAPATESSSGSPESSESSGPSESSSGTTGDPAVCGDDAIGGDEVCDGVDLDDETCIGLNFDAGELGCLKNCSAFDTSGCITFSCGNDLIEGNMEVCDGTDLADQTCELLGFDAGTLGCLDNCSDYDTSGCIMFSCGNDLREGMEVCDGDDLDGATCVTEGFDEGTLGCAGDCSGYDTSACIDWVCGNDLTEPDEFCDGTDLGGSDCVSEGFDEGTLGCAGDCSDYDTSACVTWVCGNDILEPNEQCDNADVGGETCVGVGADFGTLGCGGDCNFDLGTCIFVVDEVEPNDDGAVAIGTNDFLAANANGPFSANVFIGATINPAGDDDVFAINNPGPGYVNLRLQTFGPGGPGTCDAATDTVVDIRTAGNVALVSNDDGGITPCSLIPTFAMAPGETVYVRVIEFGDNNTIPLGYYLDVQLTPVVCGDGVVGTGEQCDDGNGNDGDDCSASCLYEPAIQEVEPNGNNAEADAAGIASDGSTFFGGSIATIGDQDRFRVDIAADGFYRFETFSALGICAATDTDLRLFDAAGVQIIADLSNVGINLCSALTFPLAAGTYYVQIEEGGNNAVIPSYLLEVATLSDQGSEAEPNETAATASVNLQMAGSDVFVFGDHTLNADSDFYAIDVTVAGSSLRLETIEGDRAIETCESNGVDSRLTLFSPALVQIADDDDEGRGFCSVIDGTGTVGLDAGAHNLPIGTYYVQVRQSASASLLGGQFTYRLVATIRQP